MESPLLSVIITAFNRRNTIAAAIESVRAQTIKDLEIIVVDDASTDQTSDLVLSIKDSRIRLIRNESNRGIGGAKNVGVEACRGKYVAFLDSDDTWLPEKSFTQISQLEKNDRIPLSFCAFYVTRENSARLLPRVPTRMGSWFDSILLGETTSLGSTLLARRNVFDDVGGFNERIKRLQDREWLIRYFNYYDDFLLVMEPLCKINNTGFPPPDLVADSIRHLIDHCKDRVAAHGNRALSKFNAALEFELAAAGVRAGEFFSPLRHLLRSVIKYPPFALIIARRGTRKLLQRDFF